MSNRERVEAEAREWSQADLWICRDCERGFIAGRTVTAGQVEAAAKALDKNFNPDQWPVMTAMFRDYAATALTAAGLLIEGEDDE